jgi:hypothetical protein
MATRMSPAIISATRLSIADRLEKDGLIGGATYGLGLVLKGSLG